MKKVDGFNRSVYAISHESIVNRVMIIYDSQFTLGNSYTIDVSRGGRSFQAVLDISKTF